MKPPKLTAKRLFWSAMIVGIAWSAVGWKWGRTGDGGPRGPMAWMASVQNGISQPVETLAVPASFVFTMAQTSLVNSVRSDSSGTLPEDAAALRAMARALQNENAQLKGMLTEANARLEAMRFLHAVHIEPEDVLPATVVGYEAGPGAAILRLDKGAMHGVKPGAAVVAALEQVHLLGRVEKDGLGQMTCNVRLISDPQMKTQAQILRPILLPAGAPQPARNEAITAGLCLVDGLGNGTMRILNIDRQTPDPQKGDLVCLTDGRWPAKVQHMVLGQVESAGLRTDQPGRYDIRVVPRISVSAQRTVMILIRE